MKHVIVGTAGHIDHGKSTLVEALTGTHPDRLEEEKRRGITIDLGFAFLNLDPVRLGFVDVPGHERFVRNMLAGVGGIDLLLLVIAADEGIKPQTREHFDICRLLGIPRGIVALTKSDLVDADALALVQLEIEDYLRGSFLEGSPIVVVSSRTGAGLDPLRQALLTAAQAVPARSASRHFRLPIDRAFTMRGFGAVVTGTLVSGAIQPGDEAELYPTRQAVRVRGLHSGGAAIRQAVAGQRTAVNLAGIDRAEIERGMVLAPLGLFRPTRRLDARLTLLSSARPLKNHARVHFHQGTAETTAETVLLEAQELPPGSSALVQLKLDHEILVLPGDRFILRQFSPVITIGGGVVLDAVAQRHKRSDTLTLDFLRTVESGSAPELLASIAGREPRGLTLPDIIAATGWDREKIEQIAATLSGEKRLRIISEQPWIVSSEQAIARCRDALRELIEKFHRNDPLSPGIAKQDLHGRLLKVSPHVFDAALGDLLASRILAISGDLVHRADRTISLSAEESSAKDLIEREFERAGLAVPSFADLLAKLPLEPARSQKILQIMLREGILVKITAELIFHRAALARLRDLLASYRQAHGSRLPIPEFKRLTGITRKYAIPLLEYLDRQQVTRRVGDERVIL